MKHFTCIGRSHGAPAIPATREDWEKMRRERKFKSLEKGMFLRIDKGEMIECTSI